MSFEPSAPLPQVRFDPIRRSHRPLLAMWLAEPHVAEWWGDPNEQLELVMQDIDEPLMDGFVFSIGDVPAGYIQSYPAAAWPGHPFGNLADGKAMAIDMFLGDPRLLGKGHGARALAAFAEKLFAEGVERALIDPDTDNARAIRAYASAGFVGYGIGEGADGPALVMMRDR